MTLLDLGQVCKLLGSLAIGYFLTTTFLQWHRLRHIPGPALASFSYLWLGHLGYSGKQDAVYRTLEEKYGPVVRVGPNEVVINDPETIRRITNTKSLYPRSSWYDGARFHPDRDAMFTLVDPVKHDKLKAKTAIGYSGRETPGLEVAVDHQIGNLIDLIRRKYVRKEGSPSKMAPLDLTKALPLYTLDVISRIALGKEFGCLAADRDIHGFYHIIDQYLPVLNVLGDVPWVRNIVFSKMGIRLIGPKPTDRTGLGVMMKITNEEVRKRYEGDVDDESATGILASFRRHGLTEGECQTEGFFMFVAGSETTASALRMIMLYIISTPAAYSKLKAEMKAAIESGRVSNPITAAEAKELPYLQGVLYEGIRIRATVTASFGKEVPPGGDTIHGHFIPAGTSVGPNLSGLMGSKTLFGEDADVFRPERFVDADPVRRTEMMRNVDLIFGYGRWMCAGKVIAWLELNKTVFELLRAFDFQIYNPRVAVKSLSHGTWVDKNILVVPTETDPASR